MIYIDRLMIQGKLLTLNIGNSHPFKAKYTFSLADRNLALRINKKIKELDPDIICAQEIWTFTDEVFGESYEYLGQNDAIAVKKSFGTIVKDSFKSNSIQFKKNIDSKIYPNLKDKEALRNHLENLSKNPYNGTKESPYGIPASFDVTSILVKPHNSPDQFLLVNVHIHSQPVNDKIRAKEIRDWIINDCLVRANKLCNGRILIAGDFNHDENKWQKKESTKAIAELLSYPNMKDAASNNLGHTTNYPGLKYRLDHIFGTATFTNYQIHQSLINEDYNELKRKHKFIHWIYLDHKSLSVDFQF